MDRQKDDRPPAESEDRVEGIYAAPESYEATLPADERRRAQDAAYLREMLNAPTGGKFRATRAPAPAPRAEPRVLPAEPWAWAGRRSRHWRKG